MMPRAKQLSMRGRERAWRCDEPHAPGVTPPNRSPAGCIDLPPTPTAHDVATAMANHERSARSGSTILV